MTVLPHDVTDLYLAPVAISLSERLSEYDGLTLHQIEYRIALATDRQPYTVEERGELALRALSHLIDMHGWRMEWVARGLRLVHGEHEIVLGVPDSLRYYLFG